MPKVRYLRIRFANPIFPNEIHWFRSAVIEKTRRNSDHFHNHDGEAGYHYRYPLIQYKVTHKKASIVCLQDGTDEIHHLLGRRDLQFRIGSRQEEYSIEDVQLNYFHVDLWERSFHYSLLRWIPLNQQNYKEWAMLEGDVSAQGVMLERLLKGHLLGFATGVDWQVPGQGPGG